MLTSLVEMKHLQKTKSCFSPASELVPPREPKYEIILEEDEQLEKEEEHERSAQEKRLSKKERRKKKRYRFVSCMTHTVAEQLIKRVFSDKRVWTSTLYLIIAEARTTTAKTPRVNFQVSRLPFCKERERENNELVR